MSNETLFYNVCVIFGAVLLGLSDHPVLMVFCLMCLASEKRCDTCEKRCAHYSPRQKEEAANV